MLHQPAHLSSPEKLSFFTAGILHTIQTHSLSFGPQYSPSITRLAFLLHVVSSWLGLLHRTKEKLSHCNKSVVQKGARCFTMLHLITNTHIIHVQEQYVRKSILNQAEFLKQRDWERERENAHKILIARIMLIDHRTYSTKRVPHKD